MKTATSTFSSSHFLILKLGGSLTGGRAFSLIITVPFLLRKTFPNYWPLQGSKRPLNALRERKWVKLPAS